MIESRIYVGLCDRDSHEQIHDTETYKEALKNICRNHKSPFSLQVIEGGYFHNDGSWVDENTLLITLIGTPQMVVYKIAKEVCTAFHQESVMITGNSVLRFNVHDDPDMMGYKNSGEAGWAQTPEVFQVIEDQKRKHIRD
jgi:hypothetical protein